MRARDLLGFGKLLNPPSPPPAEAERAPSRSPEAQALFDYKREALEMASASAREQNRAPNMIDYFIAAEQLGETRKQEMTALGIEWTAAVYADLSGQSISGQSKDELFLITKADLEPSLAVQMSATIQAGETARAQGRAPTRIDTLQALNTIQRSGKPLPSIESMRDSMDLDGDHTIAALFDEIDRHANFQGTVFSNVTFHPAGTLMRDGENGIALTEGASFKNVTFDGMGSNDQLTLANATYEGLQFINIKEGEVTIADGTQVNGMDISGAAISLKIGRASVDKLNASNAHILRFEAPGAVISNANFTGTTIDMASKLEGSTWRNVTFDGANLIDVAMRGATLNNVDFSNADLGGLDLSGAMLTNIIINNQPITSIAQLQGMGIDVADNTTVSASPEFLAASIGRTIMGPALASIGQRVPQASQEIQPTVPSPASKSTIIGGVDADSDNIVPGTLIASMGRTVPVSEQASGANMNVDRGSRPA